MGSSQHPRDSKRVRVIRSAKTVRKARPRAPVKHSSPQPDLIDIKLPGCTPNDLDDIRNQLEVIYAAVVTVTVALTVARAENDLNFSATLRFAVLSPLFDVLERLDTSLLEAEVMP